MRDFEIKFDETSLKKFESSFKKYPSKLVQAGKDIIKSATLIGERGVVNAVRSGPTRAVRTGNLMSLIHSKFSGFQGFVMSGASYSIYVHEGTRYMRARPYLDVGLKNVENEITLKARQILDKAIQ